MKKFFRLFTLIFLAIISTIFISACNTDSTETIEVKETTIAPTEDFSNYVVTAELVNVRKEPNTESEILDSYYKNTLISATETENTEWNKIKLSDSSVAYVFAEYVAPINNDNYELYQQYQLKDKEKKYAVISEEYGNLKSFPSLNSDIVAVYRKNDTIEILGTTQNDWYMMEHNDIICYISPDIVTILSKYEYDGYNKKITKGEYNKDNCSLIGTYSTDYSFSAENREYNLEKAASKINNMVIETGAMFNWCRDMGPCGKDDGYLESNEIVNGEYVTGYGGGICQLSSTLCAALINSESDITFIDRSKHSIAQSYIPSDLDATVSYPDCNFIVRNDNPYRILITTSCSDDNTLTVNIYKMDRVIV